MFPAWGRSSAAFEATAAAGQVSFLWWIVVSVTATRTAVQAQAPPSIPDSRVSGVAPAASNRAGSLQCTRGDLVEFLPSPAA
ncbi:hypothetical protein NHX12_031183, partial [Muraenolepis orangiensis]